MDKINGLNHIVELLRNRLAQKQNETKRTSTDATTNKANQETASIKREKISTRELENQIINKIQLLKPSDPSFQKKAIKIFVDDTLSWEFGTDILNSSDFITLRKNLEKAIQENPKLHDQFCDFIEKLGID